MLDFFFLRYHSLDRSADGEEINDQHDLQADKNGNRAAKFTTTDLDVDLVLTPFNFF